MGEGSVVSIARGRGNICSEPYSMPGSMTGGWLFNLVCFRVNNDTECC